MRPQFIRKDGHGIYFNVPFFEPLFLFQISKPIPPRPSISRPSNLLDQSSAPSVIISPPRPSISLPSNPPRSIFRAICHTHHPHTFFIVFYNPKPLILREGLFIRKNKDRWEKLEADAPSSPDEMATDFTRLVDDLAYAKTFYPTSRVTRYINSLASRIYLRIYRNRKEESNRLLRFWKFDVPFTIAKHYRIILVAFIIFCVFFAIGFFSASKDPSFTAEIIGEDYVQMTEENIKVERAKANGGEILKRKAN